MWSLGIVVAALAGAWYGDLASAIPVTAIVDQGDAPVLQPPRAALALVERRIMLYGGMPHDARLTAFTTFKHHTVFPGGRTSPGSVIGYNLTYQPEDAVSVDDVIRVHVDAGTERTCLDGGSLDVPSAARMGPASCSHYRIAFPLRVSGFARTWRPRAVRWLRLRWDRRFAPMAPGPSVLESQCSHPNPDAVRRIVAAIDGPLQLKGRFDEQALWEPSAETVRNGGGAIATWAPPYPVVRFGPRNGSVVDEIAIRQAIVLDGPVGGRPERLLLAKVDWDAAMRRLAALDPEAARRARSRPRRDVVALLTASEERVCRFVHDPTVAPPPVEPPAWDAIVGLVRSHAEDEGRRLVAYRGDAPASTVVASDRHAGAFSTVDVATVRGAERWRARYTVDEREPGLREADYTRE